MVCAIGGLKGPKYDNIVLDHQKGGSDSSAHSICESLSKWKSDDGSIKFKVYSETKMQARKDAQLPLGDSPTSPPPAPFP